MNEIQILEKAGLTEGETRVYLALLELGKSSAGRIIKKSGVTPSKIYDVLSRLVRKGLIGYIIEGKIRKYTAAHPTRILEYLKQREEDIQELKGEIKGVIPSLELRMRLAEKEESAEILEGTRGIKMFFDMSLEETKKGDEVLVFGYPPEASILFNSYFKKFHKERPKKGVYCRVIYDYKTWFLKKREKRRLMEQRYLPKGIETPAFVYVFNEKVGTIIISDRQKLCFMIKNKKIADSYKQYFNIMWRIAVKTGQ